jgi:hypothetical protein
MERRKDINLINHSVHFVTSFDVRVFGKNDSYDLIEVDQTFVLSSDYTKA